MLRGMKLLLAVAVALAFSAPATAAPDFSAAPRLATPASFVAGKTVRVECAANDDAWARFLESVGYPGAVANGWAVAGTSVAKLSPIICSSLRAKMNGKVVANNLFAPSLLGLVHESIHLRGVLDEGETDCAAIHEMPRIAVRYFGVKAGKQLRAVMAAAWAYRKRQPPPYRTKC